MMQAFEDQYNKILGDKAVKMYIFWVYYVHSDIVKFTFEMQNKVLG